MVVGDIEDTEGMTWRQKWLLGVSSLALMTPSMGINAGYFLVTPQTGVPVTLSWTLAGVAASSVVLAGMTPLVLRKALKNRRRGVAALATLGLVPLMVFNLANAIGAASIMKDASRGVRGAAIQVSSSLDADIVRLEDRRRPLAKVADGKTPAMVEAALSGYRADARWRSSGNCETRITTSAAWCQEYRQHEAVLGAARAIEKIDAELGRLSKQRRQGTTSTVATGTTDPASRAIVGLLKPLWELGEQTVATAWSLLAAIAVEVMAFIGPIMVATLIEPNAPRAPKAPGGPDGGRPREEDAEPQADAPAVEELQPHRSRPALTVVAEIPEQAPPGPVEQSVAQGVASVAKRPIIPPKQAIEVSSAESVIRDFMADRIETGVRGVTLQSGDFREALKRWCEANDRELPNPTVMGNAVTALGIKKQKHGGRVHYIGLKVKPGGLRLVSK